MSASDTEVARAARQESAASPVTDLAKVAERLDLGSLQAKYEHPDDRRHRQEQESADGDHRRFRERTIFIVATTLVSGLIVVAMYLLVKGSETQQRWAGDFLKVAGPAFFGYLVGKSNK